MPIVHILLADTDVPTGSKAELVARVTTAICEVMRKSPAETFVTISEVGPQNWGIGGRTVDDLRRRAEVYFPGEPSC